MSVLMDAKVIGLDWGTSSFRAFLIDDNGHILVGKTSDNGILAVKDNNFEGTLLNEIKGWLDQYATLPIIASGMITSRNGWLETPYLNLPTDINGFANALTPLEISNNKFIHFITGACYENDSGLPDIMRGEETQIIGAINSKEGDIFLLPGTHSKWAITNGENIERFTSFMTGEVYAALKNHSILGALMEDNKTSSIEAFIRGVKDRINQNSSIIHQIFTARTLPLFDKMKNHEIADYLSGLLIGEEIKSALSKYAVKKDTMIKIIGRGDLTACYASALDVFGHKHLILDDAVTAMGQYKIAEKAGLIK